MRAVAATLLLLVCTAAQAAAPLIDAQGDITGAWQFKGLPAQTLPATRYEAVNVEGRRVLRVEAQASYGHLVQELPTGTRPGHLAWSWRVDRANDRADLTRKDSDDSAIKVCASFDMPEAAVPFIERQLLRLARAASAQALPTATLCYVWDLRLPSGTLIHNAYTDRVRLLVVRGKGSALSRWDSERRDLSADFQRAFGNEFPSTPALLTLWVSADADNTRAHSLAYITDMVLQK